MTKFIAPNNWYIDLVQTTRLTIGIGRIYFIYGQIEKKKNQHLIHLCLL